MTDAAEAPDRDSGRALAAQDASACLWSRLLKLPRFPGGDGRRRLRRLLDPLAEGLAWRDPDAIKITGSNGKGSTAAMTASILRAVGVSTGLFTSPHVRTPTERIMVDGAPLDDRAFLHSARWALARVQALGVDAEGFGVGVFEALTALAIHAFTESRAEAWVLEAGIGGRFDPIGVVPGSLSALVSVDLEHTNLLGTTEAAIARDKADLADDRSTLLLGRLDPDLRDEVRQHVRPRAVSVLEAATECAVLAVRESIDGTRVDLRLGDRRLDGVTLRLPGDHQAANAALAVALASRWLARHRPGLSVDRLDTAIHRGLAEATLPGRFERIHQDPPVWVDVAHTPAAIRTLAEVVRDRLADQPLLLLTAVAEGRDPRSLLAPLVPLATGAIVTRAHHRGSDPQAVAEALAGIRGGHHRGFAIETITPLSAAIETAIERGRRAGARVLVAGGFFLAAEAIALLEGRDPRACGFV